MALFDSSKSERPDRREAVTLIGEEAYFHGILTARGSLRIDGTVEGDVTDAVSVEIGKKGKVKGNVATETLSVAGVLEGEVVASRSIELLANSRLIGNIRTPSLRIEEGAVFEGQCRMTDSAPGPAPSLVRAEKLEEEPLQAVEKSS